MSIKTKALLTMTIAGLWSLSTLAHPPESKRTHMRFIAQQLQLTDIQKQDIHALMQKGKDDANVFKQDLKELKGELQALISAADFHEQLVIDIFARYKPIMTNMASQRLVHMQQMQSLLTSEQRNKMLQLHEQRDQNSEDFIDRFEEKLEKMEAHLFAKLDLNDNQVDAIDAIKVAMEKRHNLHYLKREFHQSLRLLELQEGVTDEAFNLLFEQHNSDVVNASIEALSAARDVLPLLTETQQAKFLKMAQHSRPHRE